MTDMESGTLKLFSDGWSQLSHSPLWVLIAIVALVLGLLLKWLRFFPNQYIPLIVITFSTLAYSFLGNPGQIDSQQPYPRVILGFYGFILGFVVWAGHNWLFKRLEKFLPDGFFGTNGFDTNPPIVPDP